MPGGHSEQISTLLSVGKDVEHLKLSYTTVGSAHVAECLRKLKMHRSMIHKFHFQTWSLEKCMLCEQEAGSEMFIAEVFRLAPNWALPRCPSWKYMSIKDKLRCVYSTGHYRAGTMNRYRNPY